MTGFPGSRAALLCLSGGIILSGILLRLAPLGLDPVFCKWGGSLLWGALFWCLAGLIIPDTSTLSSTLSRTGFALVAAFTTEGLKLVHIPILEIIRQTGIGNFLLGRQFRLMDLLAYAIGILGLESIFLYTKHPRNR